MHDAESSLGDAKIPVSDVQEEREERRPVQAAPVVRTTRWTITRRIDDDADAADEDDDFTSAGKKVTFAKRGSGGSEETTGFEGPPRKRWREE